MIITKSPLRISLGGGGTDLPTYYRTHGGGFVLSAAIDKYVYVAVNRSFKSQITVNYSKHEIADNIDQIENSIVREALRLTNITSHIDIANISDVPVGTGLGSSGSFAVALLQALHTYKNEFRSPKELAEEAYHIERDLLGEPVGKQDQYISAYGGIRAFHFEIDDSVIVETPNLGLDIIKNLEDNLLLFFMGYSRSASVLLKDQDRKSKINDADMLRNLQHTKTLGYEIYNTIKGGNEKIFAEMMNYHWMIKRQRLGVSSMEIQRLYDLGMQNGALGGKLVGAGGGGFLMFYAEDKHRLRTAMQEANLQELQFRFDMEGTKVIHP